MRYIWQSTQWPKLIWDAEQLSIQLGKTRFAQGQLLSRIQSLGMDFRVEARAEMLISEAVKTSAIEGTVVNVEAVRSSVARRLGLSSAGLPAPDRYINGLVDVLLDATTRFSQPLTLARVKGWQAALFPTGFSGFHPVRAGQWRGAEPMQVLSGPIGRERVHYEAPPSDRLAREMRQFVTWWSASRGTMDGLVRAGVAHVYFVTIHPFEDGNGRIARVLTDMALAQDEKLDTRFYSLSSQIMAERKTYYAVLESTQKGGVDISAWLLWFLACAERAMKDAETRVAAIIVKAEFWQRCAGMELSARQRKVVNRLLDAGKAGFEGGLTTRKYVSLTKASRATAFREIADLVTRKLLKPNRGRGRNANYALNIP